MYVTVEPTGPLEVTELSVNNKVLTGKPLFYGSGVEATPFLVKVFNDAGEVIAVHTLKISGRTGKCDLTDKTPVKPQMER